MNSAKKIYYPGALIIAVIALAVVVYNVYENNQSSKVCGDGVVTLNGETFHVEVVRTDTARAKGLSGREVLCEKCGMLFVFDRSVQHGFWMKDMRFDIDIIWLYEGDVVHIEKGVSHKTPQKIYTPPVDADAVLEITAGSSEKYGIVLDSHMK